MYFEKVIVSEIPKRSYYKGTVNEILKFIEDFKQSGYEAAEVKDWKHKNARSFISIARKTCVRNNIEDIKFVLSGNKAFVIRNFKGISVTDKK